jgi:hypothetical protein
MNAGKKSTETIDSPPSVSFAQALRDIFPRQSLRDAGEESRWVLKEKSAGSKKARAFCLSLFDQKCARVASNSNATIFVILIIGLTAGPAVSL